MSYQTNTSSSSSFSKLISPIYSFCSVNVWLPYKKGSANIRYTRL